MGSESVPVDDCAHIERELGILIRRRHRVPAILPGGEGQLDGTSYAVLRRLSEEGAVRLTALATALDLDASTVSRQVATLASDGLVCRERDPADGRACLLGLTEAGRRRLEQARTARRAMLRDLLDGWPAGDRACLARLLSRLNDDLDRRTAGAQPVATATGAQPVATAAGTATTDRPENA